MPTLLYSHSKGDLEKAVEIILQKANSIAFLKNDKQIEESEDLICQKEASVFLKISIPTIIDWRKNKSLPHYNFNGRFFYSKKELLEYGRNRNVK